MKLKIMTALSVITLMLVTIAGAASAKVERVPGPAEYGPWDVSGDWVFDYNHNGGENLHDMTLLQAEDGTLTGSGGAFAGVLPHEYPWTVIAGSFVNGDSITVVGDYTNLDCNFTLVGTIASGGTMSGTWTDECFGGRNGTWQTTSGEATKELIQFTGNHGQYVKSQDDKKAAAKSRIGMPVQSKGHAIEE